MLIRVIGVVGAAVFVGAAVSGLTKSQRRRSSATGAPSWMPLVLIAIGISYAWGAWIESILPMLLGVVLLFAGNIVMQRRQRGQELPPALAALQGLSDNPLRMLAHPVATIRALLAPLGHPRRTKRETDGWFEDRGL